MSRILITGGAGFIGSHLAEKLLELGHSVVVVDNLRTGKKENLKGLTLDFCQEDICNKEFMIKIMKDIDFVYHLAAMTSVVESMEDPNKCLKINVEGWFNVLEACQKNKVKKIFFASSAAVYGDSPELPKIETMPLFPLSPYAVTKLDGEYYGKIWSQRFGIPFVAARFFNVFGERQDPQSPYASVVPLFISKILKNQPITIFGDGNQTRDFVYVKDIVNAMIFLMEKAEGIFNIGYGSFITIHQLLSFIQKYLKNNKINIEYKPFRQGEIIHSYASVEKLNNLGFRPEFSLEKGLERTIMFLKGENSC